MVGPHPLPFEQSRALDPLVLVGTASTTPLALPERLSPLPYVKRRATVLPYPMGNPKIQGFSVFLLHTP
jgi:hypothetical protein